jgi:hypothetical protein
MGWIDGWMGGREEGWVNEGDGLMEGGLDGWMDGRMGWIDGWGAGGGVGE